MQTDTPTIATIAARGAVKHTSQQRSTKKIPRNRFSVEGFMLYLFATLMIVAIGSSMLALDDILAEMTNLENGPNTRRSPPRLTVSVASPDYYLKNSTASSVMGTDMLSTTMPTTASSRHLMVSSPCEGYKGILRIRNGDIKAAVSTVFFTYVINHVIYAEQHNLLPWAFFTNYSHICYDNTEHGTYERQWPVKKGAFIRKTRNTGTDKECTIRGKSSYFPGNVNLNENRMAMGNGTFIGNGVWESYFASLVPNFDYPNDPVCQQLPLVELPQLFVFPGLHVCSPWSVHSWQLYGMPKAYSMLLNQTLQQWLRPKRERGASIVSRYFQPLPWLIDLVEQANPMSSPASLSSFSTCLALHIRMTDKGDGREKRTLDDFRPYVVAFHEATQTVDASIYIATDDATVIYRIQNEWSIPPERLLSQESVLRSEGNVSVFDAFVNSRHTTNTQALVDIYGLSKCQFFVHGISAISEAAHYLNFPRLHDNSVNVDDKNRPTVEAFTTMISKYFKEEKIDVATA